MVRPRVSQQRIAVLIVSLLVLAGLGLLVIDTTRSPIDTPALPTPAEVLSAVEQVTTIPAPAPTFTTTGATTSTRRAPSSTLSAATPKAGAVPGLTSRPRQGTYRYRYAGTSLTVDGTLTVTTGPGATRQTHSLTAGVSSQKTLLDWTNDARTTLSTGGAEGAAACTWEPGLLSLRLPLATGLTWKADATCRTGPTGTATSIQRTEEAAVEGAAKTKVDGQPIDVWLISRHTVTEVTSAQNGKAFIEAQSSEMFAPSLGLVVYQVTRTATPQPDGTTGTTTQITELLERGPVSGAT